MSKEQKPEYKVAIWIKARDQLGYPCNLYPLGFNIEAFTGDQIQLKLKGAKHFPKGAWVTTEDLERFAEKLMEIVERLNILPMCNTSGVEVLWEKEGEVE